jgi:hypothetical protein
MGNLQSSREVEIIKVEIIDRAALIRERMVKLRLRGMSYGEIAKTLKVSLVDVERFFNDVIANFTSRYEKIKKEMVFTHLRRFEEIMTQLYKLRQEVFKKMQEYPFGSKERKDGLRQYLEIIKAEKEVVETVATLLGIRGGFAVNIAIAGRERPSLSKIKEVTYAEEVKDEGKIDKSAEQKVPCDADQRHSGRALPDGGHPKTPGG